jgi:hypothetical protein
MLAATVVAMGATASSTVLLHRATAAAAADRGMINLSMRALLPANGQIIPGLVLDSPCRVLIRVAGPALRGFGVTNPLPNPKVSLMAGTTPILTNDDWAGSSTNYDAVRAAATASGAFPFEFGSRDAALVADLPAGNYTCVISGDADSSGEVMVEVYRVPQ